MHLHLAKEGVMAVKMGTTISDETSSSTKTQAAPEPYLFLLYVQFFICFPVLADYTKRLQ